MNLFLLDNFRIPCIFVTLVVKHKLVSFSFGGQVLVSTCTFLPCLGATKGNLYILYKVPKRLNFGTPLTYLEL